MHLPVTYDEISRHKTICNDDYKLAAYPHSILRVFAVNDKVMVIIHYERFPPGTVRILHA